MIENPYLRRAEKARHGTMAERRIAKRIRGKLTPGSGSKQHAKGDIRKGSYLIESKSTVNASLSLKHEWLVKISKEALDAGKDPLLVVQFVDHAGNPMKAGSWFMIPERLMRELLGEVP